MTPKVNETKNNGFQLDLGQSAPRDAKHKYAQKRKKSPLIVWGSVCAAGARRGPGSTRLVAVFP